MQVCYIGKLVSRGLVVQILSSPRCPLVIVPPPPSGLRDPRPAPAAPLCPCELSLQLQFRSFLFSGEDAAQPEVT